MAFHVSESIRFIGDFGAVETTVSELGPTNEVGIRVCVDLTADTLQAAYDLEAFDLPATIPGGDVPGVDPSKPIAVELRLLDEFEILLAASSREPGVLVGDMVGLTQAKARHVLLDPGAWQVATVRQQGKRRKPGLFLTTLHDSRPPTSLAETNDEGDLNSAFDPVTHDSLAGLIAAFVSEEAGVEQMGDANWRFPFVSEHGEFSVFVAAQDHVLICAATRIEAVPKHQIAQVRELAADLNGEIVTASFDCDRIEGIVGAKAALDTEDVFVDGVLIGNVIGAAVAAMARFLPAIDAIASGELNIADLRDAPDPSDIPAINLENASPEDVEAFLADQFDE